MITDHVCNRSVHIYVHPIGDILARACEYVVELRSRNQRLQSDKVDQRDQLRKENDSLRQQLDVLRRENAALKETLDRNGLVLSQDDDILGST